MQIALVVWVRYHSSVLDDGVQARGRVADISISSPGTRAWTGRCLTAGAEGVVVPEWKPDLRGGW